MIVLGLPLADRRGPHGGVVLACAISATDRVDVHVSRPTLLQAPAWCLRALSQLQTDPPAKGWLVELERRGDDLKFWAFLNVRVFDPELVTSGTPDASGNPGAESTLPGDAGNG